MIYEGKAISVMSLDNGIAEFQFNAKDESVNKFDQGTLAEFKAAVETVQSDSNIKGLIVTSSKDAFIVGADIGEFLEAFSRSEDEIAQWVLDTNDLFNAFEDLPMPTVCAINGLALGGGTEMTLCCDYRVMAKSAQMGLPEVKLGIFPGFGGTVRMTRLIGVDNAVEWICTGSQNRSDKALKDGVVDAVVPDDQLREVALTMVQRAIDGQLDFKAKRQEKLDPLKLSALEAMMAFTSCTGMVKEKAGKHYPAPIEAINTMQQHASMKRDQAIQVEAKGFAKMARTDVAKSLVGLFFKDQALKKSASKYAKESDPVEMAAVLGAGIMGGGIAYQSARKGTPIIMKDINDDALELGMSEASKLLSKQVERGRMDVAKMGKVLGDIRPTLNYGDFGNVDVVVEAVVENEKIKKSVLAEVERHVKDGAVIATNTSTISIDQLASAVKKPENFLGMHFFNPVHKMPLVEVIRGKKTSEKAVARVVAFAKKMGKSPIVVNDCPGFYVNRVLFPYFAGFSVLLRDGADFTEVDKVMERFGWPMGPAYLMDVVGIDTGVHAAKVMAEGFPDRMQPDFKDAPTIMYETERFGQKNGVGFYQYAPDKKGRPKKSADETAYELLAPHCAERRSFDKEEIIARMMIPMCNEVARCLDEGIVASAYDADIGLIYGLGFPPFMGGALQYMESIGLKQWVQMCEQYQSLGKLYEATDTIKSMAENGQSFYNAAQ